MRIGIYGGTFDPVHLGHLLLAEHCREQHQLDQVWFLPAARNPHKADSAPATGKHRIAMLNFAIAGMPEFSVCDVELQREGASYTVDTLAGIHEQQPDDELFFLMGEDSLTDLPRWREPERILELATIVAVNRGRATVEGHSAIAHFGSALAQRFVQASMPACEISATELRRRVASGQSIRFQTPRPVEIYIRENGLYQPGAESTEIEA